MNETAGLLGRHVLADLYGVDAQLLADEQSLCDLLRASLEQAGFNILDFRSQKFPGEQSGVTAFALLSESHAAIHTYPEYNYLAADIFSCGPPDPYAAIDQLANELSPHRTDIHEQPRGVRLAPSTADEATPQVDQTTH